MAKKCMLELLAAVLSCVPATFAGQQQNPDANNPPQNNQDVPHQGPGTSNPDLQQQKKSTPNNARGESPGSNNPGQKSRDVPHQGPGTHNPDLATQRSTSAPDTSTNQQHGTKKKTKRRQQNSATAQTQTTPQR